MNAIFILAAAVVGLVGIDLARRRSDLVQGDTGEALPDPGAVVDSLAGMLGGWGTSWDEATQLPTVFESAAVTMNPSTYTPDTSMPMDGDRNARAFLDMIAAAEGTAGQPDDGYRTLFGYGTFDSYSDHPRVRVPFGNTYSTAAGRYQILARTWDGLVSKLGRGALPDFGPDNQDRAALELIRERGALNDVRAGRVAAAVGKVAKVWASLPGAGYAGQGMRSNDFILAAYRNAGGTLTS